MITLECTISRFTWSNHTTIILWKSKNDAISMWDTPLYNDNSIDISFWIVNNSENSAGIMQDTVTCRKDIVTSMQLLITIIIIIMVENWKKLLVRIRAVVVLKHKEVKGVNFWCSNLFYILAVLKQKEGIQKYRNSIFL